MSWDRALDDLKPTILHFLLNVLFLLREVDCVPTSPALLLLAAHPLQMLAVHQASVTRATELSASPALSGTAILFSLSPFGHDPEGFVFLNTYFLLKRKSAVSFIITLSHTLTQR